MQVNLKTQKSWFWTKFALKFLRFWQILQVKPCGPTSNFTVEKSGSQEPSWSILNKSQVQIGLALVENRRTCHFTDSSQNSHVFVLIFFITRQFDGKFRNLETARLGEQRQNQNKRGKNTCEFSKIEKFRQNGSDQRW